MLKCRPGRLVSAHTGLTRQAADEFSAYNIRVHAVTVGLPEWADPGAGYSDPIEALLALCSEKFAGENGKILNVG